MALTWAATDLDFGPTPAISPRISGSGTNEANPAAPSSRYPSGRSASASTRCCTPIVGFFPQAGHLPPASRVSSGVIRTSQARWPSRWYLPSSGKNSTVPPKPSPVRKAW